MSDSRMVRPCCDPHGYVPIAIDEECLTDEDCREAALEAVAHPGDWMSYLTTKELEALRKASELTDKKPPSYPSDRELTEYRDRQIEMARLGLFRAYAREKYNQGQRIWYGDGVPWRQQGG